MIFKRTALKLSTMILLVTLILITVGLFATNLALKNKYDKLDKNDKYWDYKTILSQPFKHVKVTGGNVTQIEFEPSNKPAVRVSDYWKEYKKDTTVRAYVKDDTLYISLAETSKDAGVKDWQRSNSLVRIFSPELLSVDGSDVTMILSDIKQKNLNVNLTGRSNLFIHTLNNNFDTFNIVQRDSCVTNFEMSDDYKGPKKINFQHIKADVFDHSSLNIRNGYADDFKLNMSDSSFVMLSGKSINRLNK
ncbi:hypothetical protein [Mucilaginibacter agri]|uniref:Uncharacterized protein n=1 Tax=Mucilaginibacter agri TaxID=2695265 RepID=A0A965ZFG1_9SPHI|nr:hypothetical protein [Mucilaginibacter agri]NCD68807.1 hypothetical protein [Mucilaginibacter agri]